MTSLQADGTAVRGPDPEERVDALLRDLGTRLDGLGARGADRRLRQFGANEIRPLERPSRVRELARQLVDPLAPLLWMAVGFSLLQGTVLIVAVILINAGFSFVQELHAERATEALRAFLPRRARVRRDGAVASSTRPSSCRATSCSSPRATGCPQTRACSPLVPILYLSQALNAILLVPVLWAIRRLASDASLMGDKALSRGDRFATGVALAAITLAVAALGLLTLSS